MSSFFARYRRHYTRRILDLILPPRCPMTGELVEQNGTLSPRYWTKLNFIRDPLCTCCGAPFLTPLEHNMVCATCLKNPPIFTRARAVFRYDDASAPIILKFKHADGTTLAPLLARWMHQSGEELCAASDVVIPVPLHRWRLITRRYNQAALLSRLIATTANLAHEPMALKRNRHTPPQGKKTIAQRFENTRNAFSVPRHLQPRIKDKNILLIDDVYTSGATIQHCADTLLKHGAASVNVLTLARTGVAQ